MPLENDLTGHLGWGGRLVAASGRTGLRVEDRRAET